MHLLYHHKKTKIIIMNKKDIFITALLFWQVLQCLAMEDSEVDPFSEYHNSLMPATTNAIKHRKKTFQCSLCPRVNDQLANIKKHVLTQHYNSPEVRIQQIAPSGSITRLIEVEELGKLYICLECSKPFRTHYRLSAHAKQKKHMQEHDQNGLCDTEHTETKINYQPPDLTLASVNPQILHRYEEFPNAQLALDRILEIQKQLNPEIKNPKNFKPPPTNSERHQTKKFQCSLCTLSSDRLINIQNHILVKHYDQPEARIKENSPSGDTIQLLEVNDLGKVYTCPTCTKSFRIFARLKTHMKQENHSNEYYLSNYSDETYLNAQINLLQPNSAQTSIDPQFLHIVQEPPDSGKMIVSNYQKEIIGNKKREINPPNYTHCSVCDYTIPQRYFNRHIKSMLHQMHFEVKKCQSKSKELQMQTIDPIDQMSPIDQSVLLNSFFEPEFKILSQENKVIDNE